MNKSVSLGCKIDKTQNKKRMRSKNSNRSTDNEKGCNMRLSSFDVNQKENRKAYPCFADCPDSMKVLIYAEYEVKSSFADERRQTV